MSDLFVLAVMASVALSCGLTVAFLEHLKPSDDASSDGPHGDVIALPDDFESSFHGRKE